MRRALAIPAALLTAAVLARVLLTRAPAAIGPDLAQPLAVVTNWHAFGATLLATLAGALAIATYAYVRMLRGTGGLSLFAILGTGALALVAAWCVPVLFSSDVYAYAAYGELVRTGGDPYAHALLARGDPLFGAAIWQWGNPPPVCVYGPLFVAIAAAVVAVLTHAGALAQLDGLRAVASVALLLCAALAYGSYSGPPAARVTAAATIGLNPVAIWCAAEGHNDAIALFFVLAGHALVRRKAIALGAAAIAASGSIKLIGATALLGFARADRRTQIAMGAALLATAAGSVPLLIGAFAHLAPTGRYAPQASLQGAVTSLVSLLAGNNAPAAPIAWIAATTVAAVIGVHAVRLLRARSHEGWAWLTAAAWVLVPNPYPWYGLWLVAAAALVPRSRIGNVLVLLSLSSLLRYVPDGVGVPDPSVTFALGAIASLPFLLLVPLLGQQRADALGAPVPVQHDD